MTVTEAETGCGRFYLATYRLCDIYCSRLNLGNCNLAASFDCLPLRLRLCFAAGHFEGFFRRDDALRGREGCCWQMALFGGAYQFVSIAQGHCLPLASSAQKLCPCRGRPALPFACALPLTKFALTSSSLPFHLASSLLHRLRCRVFCRRTVVSSFRFNKRRFRLPVCRCRRRIYTRLLSGRNQGNQGNQPATSSCSSPSLPRNCRAHLLESRRFASAASSHLLAI